MQRLALPVRLRSFSTGGLTISKSEHEPCNVRPIFSPNVLIYVHLRHEFTSRAISNDFEQFRFSKNILKKKRRKKTKTKFPTLNEKNMEMFNEKNCYFLIECRNHSINLISFSKNFEEKNKRDRFEIRVYLYIVLDAVIRARINVGEERRSRKLKIKIKGEINGGNDQQE